MKSRQTCITFQCIGIRSTKDWAIGKVTFLNPEQFHREVISIPIYPGLSQQDQDTVIRIIQGLFEK